MKKKHFLKTIFTVLLCCFLFTSCRETLFSDISIGETFDHNRDGYSLKVHDNYYIGVWLGNRCDVYKLDDEMLSYPLHEACTSENSKHLLNGYFTKGIFCDDFLLLYEKCGETMYRYCFIDLAVDKAQVSRYDDTADIQLHLSEKYGIAFDNLEWTELLDDTDVSTV